MFFQKVFIQIDDKIFGIGSRKGSKKSSKSSSSNNKSGSAASGPQQGTQKTESSSSNSTTNNNNNNDNYLNTLGSIQAKYGLNSKSTVLSKISSKDSK